MAHIADDVGQLLQIARSRKAPTREMESKLESHRAFIVAAFLEGLPIPTVQGSWRSIVLLKSVTRICARGFIASRSFEQPTSSLSLPRRCVRAAPVTFLLRKKEEHQGLSGDLLYSFSLLSNLARERKTRIAHGGFRLVSEVVRNRRVCNSVASRRPACSRITAACGIGTSVLKPIGSGNGAKRGDSLR